VLTGDLVEARMVQVRRMEDRADYRDVRLLDGTDLRTRALPTGGGPGRRGARGKRTLV
jgi:hypothetical protein